MSIEISDAGTGLVGTLSPGGRGVPLLYLHGQLCHRHILDELLERTKGRRPASSVDLPWHGESSRPTTGFEAFPDAVLGWADALGWGRFDVVAHSLGAVAAVAAALRAPHRFGRLLLIGFPGDLTAGQRDELRAFGSMVEGGFAAAHATLAADVWYTKEYRAAHPELEDRLLLMLRSNDPKAAAHVFRVCADMPDHASQAGTLPPTTFVSMDEDTRAPPAAVGAFANKAGGRVVRLPGGHFPWDEHPQEFTRVLDEFFEGS